MKKYLILLAMLLVAVANYAEKPANYVEASQEAYSCLLYTSDAADEL